MDSSGRLKTVLEITIFISVSVLYGKNADTESSPFIISKPITHTELIESASHDYTINLGGTVDMDNTTTRGYGSFKIAFQPNIFLDIENTGSTVVEDPWIVINNVRDWRTIDSIIAEATRGAVDDQDRLMLIYEFARSNRYHDNPLFPRDELHDPVKHFNSYTAGFCDDMGSVTCALAFHAGFTKELQGGDPVLRSMHGHVMSEISVNGRYQFLDTDENAFYLDPENERPVSGDEIVRDSDLAARDYAYGPLLQSLGTGEKASALLGRDDGKGRSIVIGHEMHLTLRPGEKLSLRWDNVVKTPGPKTLKYYANSFLKYKPELNETCIALAHESKGVKAHDNAIVGKGSDAFITFEVKSPYVICGGLVSADIKCSKDTDNVSVAVSRDGKIWADVWQCKGKDSFSCKVILDDSLGIKTNAACYSYFVRINLFSEKGSVKLSSLKLHTDLLTAPFSLPRLSLGTNNIRYTDKTIGARELIVTHHYRESSNINPPAQTQLMYPDDKTVCDESWITFKWSEVQNADKYHLRVSRRSDLRTPYRPCYDVIIDDTSFVNPRTGLFNPGEVYYWGVRARNDKGVWGNWCPVQTFSWSGPRPPVDLKTVTDNGKIYLAWRPNPRGKRPVRYEIYASNLKGFKPSKTPYTVFSRGEVTSNLIAETTETKVLIVSPYPKDKAPNKSSYRVIAIDENGTPGGSSWPLELEHPFIYSTPPREVKAGKQYKYTVLTLRSIGDLQYRYQKPGYGFWEKEGYEFFLKEAPEWLSIDKDTGIISGTPDADDDVKSNITVIVHRTWPHEVKKNQHRPEIFRKDRPHYQASDEQSFTLTVTR